MSAASRFLKFTRQLHLYLGVFAIPALLFFAVSGGLQTFGLHERSHNGGSYEPPAWLARLGMLHKKQAFILPPARKPNPGPSDADSGAHSPPSVVQPKRAGEAASLPAASPAPEHGPDQAHGPALAPGPSADRSLSARNLWPMKIYFALISLALLLSTISGLYMSYKYTRKHTLINWTLAAGIAVPLILLLI